MYLRFYILVLETEYLIDTTNSTLETKKLTLALQLIVPLSLICQKKLSSTSSNLDSLSRKDN